MTNRAIRARVVSIVGRSARDIAVNTVLASPALPRGLRWAALRALGLDVQRSTLNGHMFLGSRSVSIGRDVFINYGAFIDGAAPVTIGDRCSLGPRVVILTGSHEIGDRRRRAGTQDAAPVTIGEGSWIGAQATILPGVTIGPGSIVAAGAVVAQDVPADTLVAGVPARVIRRLPDELDEAG